MNKLKIIGNPTILGDLDFLENFRFPNKRKFPISYKRFVKEYGYGKALGGWFIYIPMGNYGDSWLEQNPLFKERFEDVLDWDEEIVDMILEPDGSRELMQNVNLSPKVRMVHIYFGILKVSLLKKNLTYI